MFSGSLNCTSFSLSTRRRDEKEEYKEVTRDIVTYHGVSRLTSRSLGSQ